MPIARRDAVEIWSSIARPAALASRTGRPPTRGAGHRAVLSQGRHPRHMAFPRRMEIPAGRRPCFLALPPPGPGDMIRENWPFLFILTVALIAMVVFPESVLWLPRQFGYKG